MSLFDKDGSFWSGRGGNDRGIIFSDTENMNKEHIESRCAMQTGSNYFSVGTTAGTRHVKAGPVNLV